MGNLKTAIIATNAVLIALSSAAIACRIGRRVFLVRSFSWHDALITVAALSATIFSTLQMISTRYGLGLHDEQLQQSQLEQLELSMKLSLASRIFYFMCNWAVKHSLLLFYSTLTIDHYPRLSIYTMHFVAFSFGFTCILFTLIRCLPITDIHIAPGGAEYSRRCVNTVDFNYFNSCFMLANDIVLYAMPLVFTWKLHVSRPQRLAVNLLFLLGTLVLAASAARIYFVYKQAHRPDFTYRFAMAMLCAVIENHLAIIVACAPSIKVMLLHVFPGLEGRFEKLVSKGSKSEGSEWSFGAGVVEEVLGRGRGEVTLVGERGTRERKWWCPPSSWEVNREGKEEGPEREREKEKERAGSMPA
ncbi:hypothetical protein HBH64_193890 [Parastagonospora nodorum]|nr:hypothetical protein HBI02_049540 [Parastagonospora nodorum]KAH4679182.1 hypothetical protein HBH80_047730 [Parastagonospora nodorum]KAH4740287.1 hypothetical protein HBH64_193890 [Parastagonospora nodorum]